MTLHINLDIVLTTEVFSTASDDKVWSIQIDLSRMETIDKAISKSIDTIIRLLKKDDIIGS